MFRRIFSVGALSVVALMAGCAHPISMAPKSENIQHATSGKIAKTVGYVLTQADLDKEVESPGGGGDKVKYHPYRDIEPGLYSAFSDVFDNVVKLSATNDPSVASRGVQLVIIPTVVTTSSSSSAFTWPPTDFTVELNCSVLNPAGLPIKQIKAVGHGQASFSEFKSEFSLSARRASEQALSNLVKALAEAPELRQ